MSNARFAILQARAVKDRRITDAQFRTLAALGMYADEDGWCYPSLSTIGKDLGKSKQAVGRDTIALRELGYLEVTHRYNKDGGRRSNLYRLKFDLPPRQRDVDAPSTLSVDAPSTLSVDAPSTSDVDVNDPINDPINDPMKGKKGRASPRDAAHPKANQIPELVLFHSLRGRYPAKHQYGVVIKAVRAIGARLSREATRDDLLPFWEAWAEKGWNPDNLAWLTEWAVSGQIPTNNLGKNSKNGGTTNGNSNHPKRNVEYTPATIELAERINAERAARRGL